MLKHAVVVSVLSGVAGVGSAQIAPMTNATGSPLLERLLQGSGVVMSQIPAGSVEYVGMVTGGSQAGLFESLTLHGAAGTTQTLGPGIVLTSGVVDGLPITNTTWAYSNVTSTGGNNYFRDFPATTGTTRHSGRLQEHDENSLTFDLDVPAGVVGCRVQFVYASEEFPEWAGTSYADGFGFFVDGVNYATLPDGRPVSLLSQADTIHFMTNGEPGDATKPLVAGLEYDGVTRVLELTAPLRAGRANTITLVVADTGDEIYDSAVFVTGVQLIAGDTPLNPEDCHVRVRHRSADDETFLEHAACGTPDFNGDGDAGTDADIEAFFACLGGACCAACGTSDFNGDGDVGTDGDIEAFFRVLAGGTC